MKLTENNYIVKAKKAARKQAIVIIATHDTL